MLIKIPFSQTTFLFRNGSKEFVPMISKEIVGSVKGSSTSEATEKASLNALEKVCEFWKTPVTKFYANLVSLI